MPLQFTCPAPLLARGFATHEERPAHLPALRALLRRQRWDDFAMLPWDDAAKAALIDQQFDATSLDAVTAVIDEKLAGWMWLKRSPLAPDLPPIASSRRRVATSFCKARRASARCVTRSASSTGEAFNIPATSINFASCARR